MPFRHTTTSIPVVLHAFLIAALCSNSDTGEIEDIHFSHSYTDVPAMYADPKYQGIFFDQAFFVGPAVRSNFNLGIADYIPVHLSETQKLYRSGAVRCVVAMVSVSTHGMGGYISLGVSVDCSIAALEVSKTKIAVVIIVSHTLTQRADVQCISGLYHSMRRCFLGIAAIGR